MPLHFLKTVFDHDPSIPFGQKLVILAEDMSVVGLSQFPSHNSARVETGKKTAVRRQRIEPLMRKAIADFPTFTGSADLIEYSCQAQKAGEAGLPGSGSNSKILAY